MILVPSQVPNVTDAENPRKSRMFQATSINTAPFPTWVTTMFVIYQEQPAKYARCYSPYACAQSLAPSYLDYYAAAVARYQAEQAEQIRRQKAYIERQRRIRAANRALARALMPTVYVHYNFEVEEPQDEDVDMQPQTQEETMPATSIPEADHEQAEQEPVEVPEPLPEIPTVRIPIVDLNENSKVETVADQPASIKIPIVDHSETPVGAKAAHESDNESQHSELSMIEKLRQRTDALLEPANANKESSEASTAQEVTNEWINVEQNAN